MVVRSVFRFGKNELIDEDLLELDYDWHRRGLKEWIWFRVKPLRGFYFQKKLYEISFRKKLSKKFELKHFSEQDFLFEVRSIQNELDKKWQEAASSSGRTGIMDFSCAEFLYEIVRIVKPRIVVETGVANGASST